MSEPDRAAGAELVERNAKLEAEIARLRALAPQLRSCAVQPGLVLAIASELERDGVSEQS